MSSSTLLSTLERFINSGHGGTQVDYVLWYNYIPSEWASITFLVLFGLSTFIHTIQASYFRMWFLLPTAVLCGFLELIGWSARLWSSQSPFLQKPFIIQVTTLIVAPTLLVAANFILLGRVIRRLGPQYSRLTPKLYAIVFLSCDIVSLVVQGIGGTTVSVANTLKQANLGSHIALGGVLFQLVAITIYCALATEFLIRYTRERPIRHVPAGEDYRGKVDIPLKRMLYAMSVMTGFIFLRTIYRTAEFLDGFQGTIASTQPLFVIFDGAMITLAMVTLNIFHPGDLLQNPQLESDYYHDPTSSKKFNDSVNPAVMRTV
ncbi:RTA1-domain-containing protein [Lactifluus volemus]|nr:RTA1-domain-containing protein [Lactifluus volemus]